MSEIYRIAVLGDSIAWGQGLLEHEKTHSLVAQAIRNRWGYTVTTNENDILAHSGAVLGEEGLTVACPTLPNHEVTTNYPTIFAQADSLLARNKDGIKLIILDGGINDVGFSNILLKNTTAENVDKAWRFCHKQMLKLLQKLTDDHDLADATIAVLGYYQIFGIYAALAVPARLSQIMIALGIPGWAGVPALQHMVDTSEAFAGAANAALTTAVYETNLRIKCNRVCFVDPGFTPENLILGPKASIFGLKPVSLGPEDDPQVAEPRLAAAEEAEKIPCHEISTAKVRIASCGHPNARGAVAYAKEMWLQIQDKIAARRDKCHASFRDAAVIMDPVTPITKLKDLRSRYRMRPAHTERPSSLRSLVARHGEKRASHIRFLVYNTHLAPALAIGAPKPHDAAERGLEIGAMLARDYDLAALSEVWGERSEETLLASWDSSAYQVPPPCRGPCSNITSAQPGGSGLLVCGVDLQISKLTERAFGCTGVSRWVIPPPLGIGSAVPAHEGQLGAIDAGRFVDADQWVTRGVLLTQVELGVGILDIYSLDLYRGGGLDLHASWRVAKVTDLERSVVRRRQIDEFVGFFQLTHTARRQNVALVVGDFSIDANDIALKPDFNDPSRSPCTDYQYLQDKLAALGLCDLWRHQRGQVDYGYTFQISPGNQNDHLEERNEYTEGYPIVFADVRAADDRYCKDPSTLNGNGRRIDYIFVENPTPEHSFNLDITRIQRRHFKRIRAGDIQNKSQREYILDNYMSDHVGLEMVLIASAI